MHLGVLNTKVHVECKYIHILMLKTYFNITIRLFNLHLNANQLTRLYRIIYKLLSAPDQFPLEVCVSHQISCCPPPLM